MSKNMGVIMENWRKEFLYKEIKDLDGDNWADGNDLDSLGRPNVTGPVIFFSREQKYEKGGMTHGLVSHFIKHIKDMGYKSELVSLVNNFKTIVKQAIDDEETEMFYYDTQQLVPLTSELFDKMTNKQLTLVARITLDRINDDVVEGSNISDFEQQLHDQWKLLSKKYDSDAKAVIDDPAAKGAAEHDPKKVSYAKGRVAVSTYNDKITTAFGKGAKCVKDPQWCVDVLNSPKRK